MPTQTINGSATDAKHTQGNAIIAHIVNNNGGWGRGFVLAVSDLSPVPEAAYRALSKQYSKNIPLGTCQFVEVVSPNPGSSLFVANMVAQNGMDKSKVANGVLVDYPALQTCLEIVFSRASQLSASVHIPSGMGSGLAGGDKQTIHNMINDLVGKHPTVEVVLYEFTDTNAKSFVPSAI